MRQSMSRWLTVRLRVPERGKPACLEPSVRLLAGLLALVFCGCRQPPPPAQDVQLKPAACRPGYSYACWLNGWRKAKSDPSPELLAIQTSGYQFTLNLADFSKAGFSLLASPPRSYAEALTTQTDGLYHLPAADLQIAVDVNGERYRAVSCAAGTDPDPRRLGSAKMWESGRFVQHVECAGLKFESLSGKTLGCQASLSVVAWPDSLTLSVALAPDASAGAAGWKDARVDVRLDGSNLACRAEKTYAGTWTQAATNVLSLTHNLAGRIASDSGLAVQVTAGTNNVFPVAFEPAKNCLVAKAFKIQRAFKPGYTDIRDYDDFSITVDNAGPLAAEVPFLLDFRSPANITGLCPMLCDREGRPTGLPVQLSKNWHYTPMGAYLMAYASLPAKPGRTEYLLRVAYGFYGALPSASHAQLSLIGYSKKGGNGRWDQLAIGCWGETICFDMDLSLVNLVVTDVRMLMARNGRDGVKWGWTDAGWGGDWFEMLDAEGGKLAFKDLKTCYLAHGPCLSDVRHAGFYGARRDVSLEARVRTMRTDDYARTLQRFRYTFNVPAANTNISFFRQGRTSEYATPVVATGNRDGLLLEAQVPLGLKPQELFIDRLPLSGKGPWWVAFPGAKHVNNRDWGTGYRALVIRSYAATINGKTYDRPTISMPVNRSGKSAVDVDLLLVPPREVTAFRPGDGIDLEVEWITLPRVADDYYGPNEAFRKHLTENPSSWKTTFREAAGNDVQVSVRGGVVLSRYPVVIQAKKPVVDVCLTGGVGAVPVRFEGLASLQPAALYEVAGDKEILFDQAVHGNDFWQADYDEGAGTYSLTYNLPLDEKPASKWRLRTEK